VSLKPEFPAARGVVNLDAASTGLVPRRAIEAVSGYYVNSCCNAGRSAYRRSLETSAIIEDARESLAAFFGAKPEQLAFTPGATHSINWIAKGLRLSRGDKVLLTKIDHHANILPWLDLAEVEIVWVECDIHGRIDVEDFKSKISGVKVAAFSGASNVTGAVQPIKELSAISRQAGALSLVDAAQLAPHKPIDFSDIGCDYLAVSGHKMNAPKGIGLLLSSEIGAKRIKPLIVGGGSVKDVTLDGFTLKDYPEGFESGTFSVEGVIGLVASIEWLKSQNLPEIYTHERELMNRIEKLLYGFDIEVFHPSIDSTPTLSFWSGSMKAHTLACHLDRKHKIQVRSGHMCAFPFIKGILGKTDGLVRVSIGPWNTKDDVEIFSLAISELLE